MDSRRDFTSKKVFPGYFSELSEKANSGLPSAMRSSFTLNKKISIMCSSARQFCIASDDAGQLSGEDGDG